MESRKPPEIPRAIKVVEVEDGGEKLLVHAKVHRDTKSMTLGISVEVTPKPDAPAAVLPFAKPEPPEE